MFTKKEKPQANKTTPKTADPTKQAASENHAKSRLTTEKNNQSKTVIRVNYDVGFSNQLFIRGEGANLSWDKGQLLTNLKSDEWIWSTDSQFDRCEFKVLINDQVFEKGENHFVHNGASVQYTPSF